MASLMMQPFDLSQYFYTDQCSPLVMTSPTPQRPHIQGGYHVNESQLVYAQEPLPNNRNPLSNFLQNSSSAEGKKTTKDGHPAKRRGPKPDSKPALTRRQELNRQAQRTHRERKETYIKTLEDQVMTLRDAYTQMAAERDHFAQENAKLRENQLRHGLSLDFLSSEGHIGSSTASMSGSYGGGPSGTPSGPASTGYTSPPHAHQSLCPPSSSGDNSAVGSGTNHDAVGVAISTGGHAIHSQQPAANPAINYDQIGIDFVLTYDNHSHLSPHHHHHQNVHQPSPPRVPQHQHHHSPYLSPPPNE